jgi:uncharacterized repeat protein (TIGR02543 family)
VTFDANGGNDVSLVLPVKYGDEYTAALLEAALPIATRDNYAFDGWYLHKDGKEIVDDLEIVDDSIVAVGYAHTLYAHWKDLRKTITFDAAGGRLYGERERLVLPGVAYGALPVALPEDFINYRFDGWYASPNGGGAKVTDATLAASDATIYANYAPNAIKLFFDPQGGTSSELYRDVVYGSAYGTLPTPERNGYTFDGWYASLADSVPISATDVFDHSTSVLYAKWTEKGKVEIGGVPGNATVNVGDPINAIPAPANPGYDFDGWYTDPVGGTKYTDGDVVREDSEIYAHFTPQTFKLIFDAQGGSTSALTGDIVYGTTYGNLPVPEREGFIFGGWYADAALTQPIKATDTFGTASWQALYAKWSKGPATPKDDEVKQEENKPPAGEIDRYTVALNANGGKASVSSKTYTKGDALGGLPTPTRTGYKFSGWYTKKTGGSKITAASKATGDATLYAHWTAKKYTIKYNANKGKVKVKSKKVSYASKYGKLTKPTRKGYTFKGWYTKKTGGVKVTKGSKVKITKTTTLYAHWTKIKK